MILNALIYRMTFYGIILVILLTVGFFQVACFNILFTLCYDGVSIERFCLYLGQQVL